MMTIDFIYLLLERNAFNDVVYFGLSCNKILHTPGAYKHDEEIKRHKGREDEGAIA